MPTAYSRVTVVNGTRRVDLALPSALPLSDVLPQLLGFCAPEARPDQPAGWTLARLGRPGLSLARSLADAGVTDGEVLELRTGQQAARPAYVEDVRDALEDRTDQTARPWRPQTTAGFALVAGTAGLALASLLPPARTPRSGGALAAALLVAGVLVLAAWLAARRGHPLVARLVVAVAALWGGVAGWLATTFPDWPPAPAAAGALVGAVLVTAAARAATPVATEQLAGLAPLAAAGAGIGVAGLAGADPLAGVRVAAAGAVLLVGILPRVSLTVGGLASADYLVRQHGQVTGEALAARIARSNALLSGGLLGTAALGIAAGGLLAASDSVWDRLLGATVGVALVLRSRVFSRMPQIVPLRAAGLLVLAVQAGQLVLQTPALRPWPAALALAVSGGAVGLSAVPLSEVARARVAQLLDRAELVTVMVMVALVAAALGGFDWMGRLAPG